jgi:ribose-phosphate pyrophosphokinase
MRDDTSMMLFALNASRDFGERVGVRLGVRLSAHEEREFEDGEHKARPLVSVRDRDVFVIQSLYGDERHSVNDKLCRLLFFLGAIKDAAAGRVSAVIPYLAYARKDRKTKSRDPVTTRYLAALLEAVGTERVMTMDVHNLAAFQNAFRCTTEHLEARKLIISGLIPLLGDAPVTVVSPDVGGVKRAEQLREGLATRLSGPVGMAFMEKKRSAGVVSGEILVGDVRDRTVVIADDMIGSGTTVSRAVRACKTAGAGRVVGAATHGLFVGEASAVLADPALEALLVTDTVRPFRLVPGPAADKLIRLDATALFAEAIRRVHSGGSIVELLAV